MLLVKDCKERNNKKRKKGLCASKMDCLMGRVFANDPGDQGSIPGQIIPETQNKKGTWCCLA